MKYISKEDQDLFKKLNEKVNDSGYIAYITTSNPQELRFVITDMTHDNIISYNNIYQALAFADGLVYSNI